MLCERFLEPVKFWILPLFLGFVAGLAIFAMVCIYKVLNFISQLIVNLNPFFTLASTVIALLGGYLTVKFFAENKGCGCGTELVIERYHYKSGFVSLRDTISRTLASVITISFGGSAGLEGPSLLLGGGLSSFITRKLKLSQKDVKALFLCGAAAGFSAIFKAPLTGILLALEIPYKRDVETEVFIPASIASVTAYFTSTITLGTETIFFIINLHIANFSRPFAFNFRRCFDSFSCFSIYGNFRESECYEQPFAHKISNALNKRICWVNARRNRLILPGNSRVGLRLHSQDYCKRVRAVVYYNFDCAFNS
jgi:H+/Cl- antiporter ClcA